jgi:hypothetical protein
MKNLVTVIILFLFTFTTAFTQVVVTPNFSGIDLERSTSCGNGDPGGFATLSNIIFTETKSKDFYSSGELSLEAPDGWQFNINVEPGAEVELVGSSSGLPKPGVIFSFLRYSGSGAMKFQLTVSNRGKTERLIISNVQVQAISCEPDPPPERYIVIYYTGILGGLSDGDTLAQLSVDGSTLLPVELASFSAILKELKLIIMALM